MSEIRHSFVLPETRALPKGLVSQFEGFKEAAANSGAVPVEELYPQLSWLNQGYYDRNVGYKPERLGCGLLIEQRSPGARTFGEGKDVPGWHIDEFSLLFSSMSIFASDATAVCAQFNLTLPSDYPLRQEKNITDAWERNKFPLELRVVNSFLMDMEPEDFWVESLEDAPSDMAGILPDGVDIAKLVTRKLKPYEVATGSTGTFLHRSALCDPRGPYTRIFGRTFHGNS